MLLDRLEIKSFTVAKHLRLLPEQKKKNLPGIEVVHPEAHSREITFETEINIFMIFDKYDH